MNGLIVPRSPEARANPNLLGAQLIAEYKAKQADVLAMGGPISDADFLARSRGTQRAYEAIRTFSDRQMAGMYLAVYRALALKTWLDGCAQEPENAKRWPSVERLLRDATDAPSIAIP